MAELEGKCALLRDLMSDAKAFERGEALCLLRELKAMLIQSPFFTTDEASMPIAQRVLFRDVLEYRAIASIWTDDMVEYARVLRQLKTVYFRDDGRLPPSERAPLLTATHLVFLLTQNRITDFGIERPVVRRALGLSEFLAYAVNLHEAVSENSFARIFALQGASPSPLFAPFTARLLDGARHSHADSIERAYRRVTLDEVAAILHFRDRGEAAAFAAQRGWSVAEAAVTFERKEDKKQAA